MSIASSFRAIGVADVIVLLKPRRGGGAATVARLPAQVERHFHYSPLSQDAALLQTLRDSGRPMSARAAAGRTNATIAAIAADAPVHFYPNLDIALGTVDREGLAALRKDDAVRKVVAAPQLQLIRPVLAHAARAAVGYTWGIRALRVDELHALGHTGVGVVIGHLDTGVDASHPALQGVLKAYAEFDALGDRVPEAAPRDSASHGTHTAGTLVGQVVDGVRFGVAPGARLASAAVIEGGRVIARVLGGMNWVVGQRARVLSMSLGLIGTKDDFLLLTRLLRARGVLPVFAVGNEGAGVTRYPGNYAEALSVGASDRDGAVGDFSGSQKFLRLNDPIVPDLVGPGVGVLSCVPGGGYMEMDGSSMATPHIAGLAAVLMSARPDKSIDQIEAAIFAACKRSPQMTLERANRGFPDAVRALQCLD